MEYKLTTYDDKIIVDDHFIHANSLPQAKRLAKKYIDEEFDDICGVDIILSDGKNKEYKFIYGQFKEIK